MTTCRELATDIGERVAGTAPPSARRWLLIEQRASWGAYAVKDIIPSDTLTALGQWGISVLLIRRFNDRRADGPGRMILSDELKTSLVQWDFSDARNAALSFVAEGGTAPSDATPLAGPLMLVCTNGNRDACCAVVGRNILSQLSDSVMTQRRTGPQSSTMPTDNEASVYESTHIGGHRFAGVTLLLPHGYVHQCKDAASAEIVLARAQAGFLELQGLRGQAGLSSAAQLAEIAVRQRCQIDQLGVSVTTEESTGPNDHIISASVADSPIITFRITTHEGQPRPESCNGAAKPYRWLELHDFETTTFGSTHRGPHD